MNACVASLIATAGAVLVISTSSAETRKYTSSDGKELEAEVLGVRGGKASLKVASGKIYEVPLERLSEADQTFLKEWSEKNPSYTLNDLRLELRKGRDSEPKDAKADNKNTDKRANISWEGTLQNATREPIDDIKVTYKIFRRDYYKSDTTSGLTTLEEVAGDAEVGTLAPGAKHDLKSEAVVEMTKVVKGERGSKDTVERQTVLGAVFTVSIKDREVITYEDPRGIVSRFEDEREREREKQERDAARLR